MDEPIVFFGTGPVAAKSLELLAQRFRIEAVVTKPRAPHHQGEVPVLDVAQKLELPVIQVVDRRETSARITPGAFKSRLGVLIDFGIIVEQSVIDAFPLGIVNSHFSLLPQWRGADPITFAVLSGQDKTGVSLMLLVAAMDEGLLLAIGETDLPPDITTPQLTDRLITLSNAILQEVLPKYTAGKVTGRTQESVAEAVGYSPTPTYSRKLTKEDGILDWGKPADQLEREIRAFIDWPKSRTILGGHAVIITGAHADAGEGKPGDLWRQGKHFGVYTSKGVMMIDRLKPAGKSEMSAEAFLAGYGKDIH